MGHPHGAHHSAVSLLVVSTTCGDGTSLYLVQCGFCQKCPSPAARAAGGEGVLRQRLGQKTPRCPPPRGPPLDWRTSGHAWDLPQLCQAGRLHLPF